MHPNVNTATRTKPIATSDLQIMLLGRPQIVLHGESIAGQLQSKAQALFFFLVVTKRAHNEMYWQISCGQKLHPLPKPANIYAIGTQSCVSFWATV
ncbi:hypothetical protein KFU94_12735 [Chloroflexi bacterium TSY]|nr:hypothetical protein [Chloroflexi bacterium TSY]